MIGGLIIAGTLGAVIVLDVLIGCLVRRWARRRRRDGELPVLFRGTAEQAGEAAAWRAMNTGKPVIACSAGGNVWELREFVAAEDLKPTEEAHE